MKDQETDNIIAAYLSGECSEEEKTALLTWINEHDDNKQYFFSLKKTWNQSLTGKKDTDINQKWMTLTKKAYRINLPVSQLLKIASIIIISVAVGALASMYVTNNLVSQELVFNETIVPYGGEAEVILSDGSKVIINAGSKLKYPSQFSDSLRQVFLEGEAFFEVTSNNKNPFIVSTGSIDVKALGTRFNVNAYEEDPVVTATLVEGIISIKSKQVKNEEIILKPNQTITYVKESRSITRDNIQNKKFEVPEKDVHLKKAVSKQINILKEINTDVYTSWKDSKWVIEEEKLGSLAKKLERRFDIEINFDNEELKNLRFSGKLQNEPVEQVLQVMELTAPLKYEIKGRNVVIKLDRSVKNYKKLYSD